MRNLAIDLVSGAVQLQPIPISMGSDEIQIWLRIIHLSITSLFDNELLTIIIPKYAIEKIYVSELQNRTLIQIDKHEYYSIQVLCTATSPVLLDVFTQNEEFSRGLLWVTTVSYENEKKLREVANLLSTCDLIEIPETNEQILTMNNDGDLFIWLNPQFTLLAIRNAVETSAAKFGWKVIERVSGT